MAPLKAVSSSLIGLVVGAAGAWIYSRFRQPDEDPAVASIIDKDPGPEISLHDLLKEAEEEAADEHDEPTVQDLVDLHAAKQPLTDAERDRLFAEIEKHLKSKS